MWSEPPPPAGPLPIEQLAEFVPGALFRYRVLPDGTDRIEHMSRGCFDLWEVSAADIENDPALLWGMVDERDVPGFAAGVAESGKRLVDWSYQWRITTPSGKRKWLHGVGRPRAESDGSVVWHSFILDVTDSQQTQEALLESEQRFRQLLDAVPNVAVQGYDDQLVCRYWNRASQRLYGWTAEEAIGRNLLDLIIPPAMHAEVRAAKRCMLDTGEPIPAGELVLVRKDGSPVSVYSSHVYLNPHGGRPEFFCIDYDLTERQQAEETRLRLEAQLRESQKMEALGTLAGGVAHDFNNIVAAILGNVELALDDVPDRGPARTSLHEIRKAGRRAREVVQQILAFSRRQESAREPVGLHALLEEAHGLLRATLPAEVGLQLHVDEALPVVMANATQIEQVILNLATNAVQAVQGRPGAQVVLRVQPAQGPPPPAGAAEVDVLPMRDEWPGVGVQLQVVDNGVGMPPDTLARIFEPFFTTKAPGAGTGLGLAVVHGILRDHGAALRVRSQPEHGTVFTIVFPGLVGQVLLQAADAAPAQESPSPRLAAAHVLYIDDDESIVFLVRRLLEREGLRVTTFLDPHAALRCLSEGGLDVDLCISDFNMPGMSGLRLAGEVKRLRPDLPVAIASGYISDELRQQAPAVGVDDLIYKPDTVEPLCAAIRRMLSARRPID